MLTAVLDRTDPGSAERVRKTFEEVEARLAREGPRIAWPVAVEVVPLPVMGATKSFGGRHTLYVSSGVVDSGMLDGLLAHEMGHMFLTESRHPSHDPTVLWQVDREVRIPFGGRRAFARALNHVQDIYADDLAFLIGLEDRAYSFFRNWIEGNASRDPERTWDRVSLSLSNGFALGNLERHGAVPPGDPLWDSVRVFDRRLGIEGVEGFARFFSSLPRETDPARFATKVRELARSMVHVARFRMFNTSERVPEPTKR